MREGAFLFICESIVMKIAPGPCSCGFGAPFTTPPQPLGDVLATPGRMAKTYLVNMQSFRVITIP
jgi:hypothetical protein